jgi:nucleotide-binding universal stress UspA family protein
VKLDDFESVFRSAVKAKFHHEPPQVESALLITDLDETQSASVQKSAEEFLSHGHSSIEWTTLNAGDFSEVADVLDRVRRNPPDLVTCYRHVLGQGAKLPYSLGSTVDTLTQATDVPVLLVPRPVEGELKVPKTTGRVMVVTDHLTGDDRLVNWASHLCTDEGTLFLSHIEDAEVLAKYLDVCSKIPGIDLSLAEEKIPKKLLAMPRDYVDSIAEVLAAHDIHETIEPIVRLGDPVKDYEKLVEEHDIDLLVMNTKDAGQSAMHPLAYALSVEIRNRPLLLL